MDTTVRIQNGYPSTVFSSVILTSLSQNTRYYWSIVEYNVSGNTASPVWYFNTQPAPAFYYDYQFESDLEGWEIIGPLGFNNWNWRNTSNAGSNSGEMGFSWDPVFIGDSYVMSPEIPSPAGADCPIGHLPMSACACKTLAFDPRPTRSPRSPAV